MLNRITKGRHQEVCIFRVHDDTKAINSQTVLNNLKNDFHKHPCQGVVLDFKNVRTINTATTNFLNNLLQFFRTHHVIIGLSGAEHLDAQVLTFLGNFKNFLSLQDAIDSIQLDISNPPIDLSDDGQNASGFFSPTKKQPEPQKDTGLFHFGNDNKNTLLQPQENPDSEKKKENISSASIINDTDKNAHSEYKWKGADFQSILVRVGSILLIMGILLISILVFEWWRGYALLHAIEQRDLHQVQALLDYGDLPNVQTETGASPLMLAILHRQEDIASVLIAHQANINYRDQYLRTPLMYAAFKGEAGIAEELLENGADANAVDIKGRTALMWGAAQKHDTVIKLLLDHKANIFPGNPFWEKVMRRNRYEDHRNIEHVVSKIKQHHSEKRQRLMDAIEWEDLASVERLVKEGVDVNARDSMQHTALMKAAHKGNISILQLLIEEGADVNAEDSLGETALIGAAFQEKTEAARFLINHGAMVNQGSTTPLMWAAFRGNVELIKILLEHGANVNVQNHEALTPLMWAADQGHINAVWMLIAAGADINAQNKSGLTPLMFAARKGHMPVVRILLNKGASQHITSLQGKTALMLSKENGYMEIGVLLKNHYLAK